MSSALTPDLGGLHDSLERQHLVPHRSLRQVVEDHPELARRLRKYAGLPDRHVRSVAIVDWTSLHHVCSLLEGAAHPQDPFVAFADMASVLAAILLYDRVVVLDGGVMGRRASRLLGVPDIIRSLDPDPPGDRRQMSAHLINEHFLHAVSVLVSAARQGSAWFESLRSNWSECLPNAVIPTPSGQEYTRMGWALPLERSDSYRQLFKETEIWRSDPLLLMTALILDNDVRALFHEYLASTLQAMFAIDRSGPRVRYVGGALRAPMQRARIEMWRSHWRTAPSARGWLPEESRQLNRDPQFPVVMPFWPSAILQSCRARSDIPQRLGEWRQLARAFRDRRSDVEDALGSGDEAELAELMGALHREIHQLTRTLPGVQSSAAVVARATIAVLAPPVPSEVMSRAVAEAAEQGRGPLTMLWLRCITSHVWILVRHQDAASELRLPRQRLQELFALPVSEKSQPDAFLARLAAVTWPV